MEQKKYNSNGLLLVISGLSGSGKTSILSEFLKKHPEVKFSVSVTTRPPRNEERDGINYYFVSDKEFDSYIEKGEFIEWAVVHGNRYGTLKRTFQEAIDKNLTTIFDTDTVGAFNIKKKFPDALMIFVVPPSLEILVQRLKKRDTETPEIIQKRLDAAPGEMARMSGYDYIVLNDTISDAVDRISAIVKAELLKTEKMLPLLNSWRKIIDGFKTE